jgi:hypothetical protein
MFLKLSKTVVALALVLVPAQLLAGGPAWLCVPIDGVTSANQEKCIQVLGDALKDSILGFGERQSALQIQRHENQWYATFHPADDVRLSEMEKALKGSEFSIPRDRMRLFGHVILEVKSPAENQKAIEQQLDALEYAAVSGDKTETSAGEIILDMPYPTQMRRGSDGVRFWEDSYQWNDLNTVTTRTDAPATTQTLPSPKDLGKVLAGHDAELKDLRWSPVYHCRAIGSVAVPKAPETANAK